MRIHQIIEQVYESIDNRSRAVNEFISSTQLKVVQKFVDKYFSQIGLDLQFTAHFLDRLNDPRNGDDITLEELIQIFVKAYKTLPILKTLTADQQAVLNDTSTFINVPFIIKYHPKRGLEMVAKTIMRKKNFGSPDPILRV